MKTEDRRDRTFEFRGKEQSAIWSPQCSFCLERPPSEQGHDHQKCPLINTLNRIRSHTELKPLEFVNGVFVREDEKVSLNVDETLRELKSTVEKLAERVKALEASLKASNPTSAAPKSKKRKGEDQQVPEPPKKVKKEGEEKGKGVASGSGSGQGQGKGKKDKGKGKAKE